jgi:hypothetical protein
LVDAGCGPVMTPRRGSPCRGEVAAHRRPPSRRRPIRRTSPRTGRATCARPPPHRRRPRPTGGDARAVGAGARSAAGPSASAPPRCSALPSAADSLPVLPTLARRDDDACDLLEVTRLADELRDRERGSRPVVAYKRHGAASRLAVELERAVRPVLRAWHGADGVGHDAALPGGGVAQSSQTPIDHHGLAGVDGTRQVRSRRFHRAPVGSSGARPARRGQGEGGAPSRPPLPRRGCGAWRSWRPRRRDPMPGSSSPARSPS